MWATTSLMYSAKKLPMTLLPKTPGLMLEDLVIDTDMVSLSVASCRLPFICSVSQFLVH